jgi:hypothetical protein
MDVLSFGIPSNLSELAVDLDSHPRVVRDEHGPFTRREHLIGTERVLKLGRCNSDLLMSLPIPLIGGNACSSS